MEIRECAEEFERNVAAEVWSVELVGLTEHIVSIKSLDIDDGLQVVEELRPERACLGEATFGEGRLLVGRQSGDRLADGVDRAAVGLAENSAVVDEAGVVVHAAVQQRYQSVLLDELVTLGYLHEDVRGLRHRQTDLHQFNEQRVNARVPRTRLENVLSQKLLQRRDRSTPREK